MLPQLRLSRIERLDENGDIERRCSSCKEWLPADFEFFYPDRTTTRGVQSFCKCCCHDKYKPNKKSDFLWDDVLFPKTEELKAHHYQGQTHGGSSSMGFAGALRNLMYGSSW